MFEGGTLTGQMYLSQSVAIPECPLPQAETYQSRQLPAGLKMRHVPFGSGKPVLFYYT